MISPNQPVKPIKSHGCDTCQTLVSVRLYPFTLKYALARNTTSTIARQNKRPDHGLLSWRRFCEEEYEVSRAARRVYDRVHPEYREHGECCHVFTSACWLQANWTDEQSDDLVPTWTMVSIPMEHLCNRWHSEKTNQRHQRSPDPHEAYGVVGFLRPSVNVHLLGTSIIIFTRLPMFKSSLVGKLGCGAGRS